MYGFWRFMYGFWVFTAAWCIKMVLYHLFISTLVVFFFYVLAWLIFQPGSPLWQSYGCRLTASSRCDHSHVHVCILAHEEVKKNNFEVLCSYFQNMHLLSDTKWRPYQLWQSRIILHSSVIWKETTFVVKILLTLCTELYLLEFFSTDNVFCPGR